MVVRRWSIQDFVEKQGISTTAGQIAEKEDMAFNGPNRTIRKVVETTTPNPFNSITLRVTTSNRQITMTSKHIAAVQRINLELVTLGN